MPRLVHYKIIVHNVIKSGIDIDLLVLRVTADGNFRMVKSLPCFQCNKGIHNKNIRYIYYSDENGNIVRTHRENLQTTYIPRKNMHGKGK